MRNMDRFDDRTANPEIFRKKLLLSMLIPGMFVCIIWLIKFLEIQIGTGFYFLGIYPYEAKGLIGIITSPFIHKDLSHLFNNTIPVFVLGSAIFYFYSEVAFRVSALTWLFTGVFVWFLGRDSWHIGASGLIYGFASFLFFSGIIRRHLRLLALSMLVVFLYGSMVWGMFPIKHIQISWESHMLGAASGLILAVWYRKHGQQQHFPDWFFEDEEEGDEATYDEANDIGKSRDGDDSSLKK